jgi:ketosteroid isomerase-like protein
MSREDVEVRQLLEPLEQVDIAAIFRDEVTWAATVAAISSAYAPDFECAYIRDDVGRATYSGTDGLRAAWLDWLSPWASYRTEIEDFIDAKEGRVLALVRDHARRDGMEAEVAFEGAAAWTVRHGKVARIDFYQDRARALADLGLEQ